MSLTFYNPNCSYTYGLNGLEDKSNNLMQPTMCANFVYNLNGHQGPNKVGKDIGFITVFYPTDSQIFAPHDILAGPATTSYDTTISSANAFCRNNYGKDAKIATIEELKSIFTNNKLGTCELTGSAVKQLFLQKAVYASSTPATTQSVYVFRAAY